MGLILPRRRASGLDVADVFLANLRTGNGSTQSVTGGPDMSGEGGLAISKRRNGVADWGWFDTERGATKFLSSNATTAETTDADTLTAFTSDGVTFGADTKFNTSSATYIDYLIRKAPKFFDVVTYTGTGLAASKAHSLGSVPGMIIVKRTDAAGDWCLWHRSVSDKLLYLNYTNAITPDFVGDGTNANETFSEDFHTDTTFGVGGASSQINVSGGTYIACIFAHDTTDGGFIQCGSYAGNGSSTGPIATLGWEPQWVLVKKTSGTGNWYIFDAKRSTSNPRTSVLRADLSNDEYTNANNSIDFLSTGFQLKNASGGFNSSGATYVYMAIKAAA